MVGREEFCSYGFFVSARVWVCSAAGVRRGVLQSFLGLSCCIPYTPCIPIPVVLRCLPPISASSPPPSLSGMVPPRALRVGGLLSPRRRSRCSLFHSSPLRPFPASRLPAYVLLDLHLDAAHDVGLYLGGLLGKLLLEPLEGRGVCGGSLCLRRPHRRAEEHRAFFVPARHVASGPRPVRSRLVAQLRVDVVGHAVADVELGHDLLDLAGRLQALHLLAHCLWGVESVSVGAACVGAVLRVPSLRLGRVLFPFPLSWVAPL